MLEDKLFDLEGTLPDSLIKSLWMIDDFVELKSQLDDAEGNNI